MSANLGFHTKPKYPSRIITKLILSDYNTTVEITPTDRAARFRITYPKTDKAYLIVDAFFQNSYIKIFPKERKIIGYARNSSGGTPENFKNYFVIYADKDFEEVFGVKEGDIKKDMLEIDSKHSGGIIRFKTAENEKVNLKIASSFISPEQAELNLKNEIGDQSFDQIVEKGAKMWNTQLNKVKVEGGSDDQLRTFYTALYHTMLFPRKFYEINAMNEIVHYSPYNGKVEKGYMFTDNGFWDTFMGCFSTFQSAFS